MPFPGIYVSRARSTSPQETPGVSQESWDPGGFLVILETSGLMLWGVRATPKHVWITAVLLCPMLRPVAAQLVDAAAIYRNAAPSVVPLTALDQNRQPTHAREQLRVRGIGVLGETTAAARTARCRPREGRRHRPGVRR